ncbi:hypothetical protein AAVH_15451 [Aphelenchoides avenae]|nr:hypothetical protein AAVH_15451 [Aphelenchus avenae]
MVHERVTSLKVTSCGLKSYDRSLAESSGSKVTSLDEEDAPFTNFPSQVPIDLSAGTSTDSDAVPRCRFQTPLHRSKVHPLLQLIHHHTQLRRGHARLHAQLLHNELHSELLQPVHRLHVRRSSPLLDAIDFGTATPTATDQGSCR